MRVFILCAVLCFIFTVAAPPEQFFPDRRELTVPGVTLNGQLNALNDVTPQRRALEQVGPTPRRGLTAKPAQGPPQRRALEQVGPTPRRGLTAKPAQGPPQRRELGEDEGNFRRELEDCGRDSRRQLVNCGPSRRKLDATRRKLEDNEEEATRRKLEDNEEEATRRKL